MNRNTILSRPIASALAFAACAAAAHAATLVNGTTGAGELFIGFHATGGTGVGKSVVIDAGSISALSALATGSVTSLGNVGTDLVSTFGSNWYERTDLIWGAVAAVQNTATADPTNTLYGGVSGTGSWPLSTVAYNRAANGAQSTVAGRILTMASNAVGSFTAASSGSASNIAIEQASDANSWASWMPNGTNATGLGNAPFGGFGSPSGQAFEQSFATGALTSGYEGALDVFRMFKTGVADAELSGATAGAGSYQGTITIGDNGALNFEVLPVAVPEPASMGTLMSLALLGTGFMRRRRVARVQAA